MIINYIYYLFIFVLVWWLVFFVVLPFGIKIPMKQESSEWASSSPSNPKIGLKVIITTILSAIITASYYMAMSNS